MTNIECLAIIDREVKKFWKRAEPRIEQERNLLNDKREVYRARYIVRFKFKNRGRYYGHPHWESFSREDLFIEDTLEFDVCNMRYWGEHKIAYYAKEMCELLKRVHERDYSCQDSSEICSQAN